MNRRKPHVYRALGHWWITYGSRNAASSHHLQASDLRRAMFGEAL